MVGLAYIYSKQANIQMDMRSFGRLSQATASQHAFIYMLHVCTSILHLCNATSHGACIEFLLLSVICVKFDQGQFSHQA